jgi:hypothetical protein
MAELEPPSANTPDAAASGPAGGGRTPDEIALDLMKFIVITTGYGRSGQASAGFSGKPGGRSPEEQADALFELFDRCRKAVKKEA